MSLRYGTEHRLTINELTLYGMGLGTIEGKPVLVSKTLPGDEVYVRMGRKKYGMKTARLLSFEKKSSLRGVAECSHFNECGGCQILDVSYGDQLILKYNMMLEGILRVVPHLKGKILPVIGCDNTLEYRNKMEYAFGFDDDSGIYLGLKKRGCYDQVIATPTCRLLSSDIQSIFVIIESVLNQQSPKLSVWNYHTHEGFLRHLTIRQSKKDGRYFLNFIVSSMEAKSQVQLVVNELVHHFQFIQGIQISLNDSVGDHTFFSTFELLYGQSTLVDSIGDLNFEISPYSFFQTNSKQARVLYDQLVKLGNFTGNEVLLDLYCGIGTIGSYLAKYVKSVVGIEEVPQAIQDAKRNQLLNGIENISFRSARVKNGLKFESFEPDVVIVDPPRSGMVPKALKRVLALEAPMLIYVSCNPASMLLDLQACENSGYNIESIQPVDMFPNTVHLETITLLKRDELK